VYAFEVGRIVLLVGGGGGNRLKINDTNAVPGPATRVLYHQTNYYYHLSPSPPSNSVVSLLSWRLNRLSLVLLLRLLVIVFIKSASPSLDFRPTRQPHSQPIHALKTSPKIALRTIQKVPTKPTPTQTPPRPTTPSFRSPHPVRAASTRIGDVTRLCQSSKAPRTLT